MFIRVRVQPILASTSWSPTENFNFFLNGESWRFA